MCVCLLIQYLTLLHRDSTLKVKGITDSEIAGAGEVTVGSRELWKDGHVWFGLDFLVEISL